MLCSQAPILRFSRCGSDQFPCIVGIGGPLHILMKTPGVFPLKGKPKFDWFCHRHFTSGYDIMPATPQICFSWSTFTTHPHQCPDPFANQPVQGLRTSECPQIGYRDLHAAGDRDGSISCNIRIASTARTGSCLMSSRSSDRASSRSTMPRINGAPQTPQFCSLGPHTEKHFGHCRGSRELLVSVSGVTTP